AAAGHPAVLVGAGPSLARNAHLLAEPGVRDRVVIIAVQTALRPLLDRGVRPHFVTALDWSAISARFYEDLPSLPDVTLVAEAKSHPSILDHYPGPVRLLQNAFLDRLLGDAARPIRPLPAGSTVAHLSFYLAQHLGCDPIVFIGQDLAFSEGLYYCPGTAIHRVWSSELNGFNSLEMMELKRILRHKSHLQERVDVHGRPCYSDEQMLTYLAQFERDFATADQTLLDATEGGLEKAHTTPTTLAEALSAHARSPLPPLPKAGTGLETERVDQARSMLRLRMDQIRRLRRNSLQTAPLLKQMLGDQRDAAKMQKHFQTLDRHRRQVQQEPEAMAMIDAVGQLIAFRRQRADRQISVSQENDPLKRQAMQLRRDIENVEWIAEACAETLQMFEEALGRLNRPEIRAGEGGR
ncbi:MAG: 6-hydroxymethylpterin diphosphokinase MptE-like protein, partial [Phycisphaeraceae bacterium]|nr:6-hydroxymethylpterin diphosphokinase MptE-like protein [Phycisphaeraceae bacterium]